MKKQQILIKVLFPNCLPAAFIVLFAALGTNLIHAQTIDWKVKEPFRFIDYSKTGTSHWAMKREETASQFVEKLMKDGDRQKLPPFESTTYIRDKIKQKSGLFSEGYFFPKEVRVVAWIDSPPDGPCNWKYGSQSGKFNCNEKFEFKARTQFGDGDAKLTVTDKSANKRFEQIILEVFVTDRLVLGLGDSFASGESNPDRPAEVDPVKLERLRKSEERGITTGRWMKNAKRNWLKSNADWLDKQCHRSLFSQHVLVAMRLAAENAKESVTLMPLACSGAEVLDGLLIPQKEPPGDAGPVADSQVNVAIRQLCPAERLTSEMKVFHRGFSGSVDLNASEQVVRRCKGGLGRTPDAILLSIGGNDVGFAPAIVWAAIPDKGRNLLGKGAVRIVEHKRPPVCPDVSSIRRCRKNIPPANYRIKHWLPHYYEYLMNELHESGLAPNANKIFLTAYPDPTFMDDGAKSCDSTTSADAIEQIRSELPRLFNTTKWGLGFSETETQKLRSSLIGPLHENMKSASDKYKWNFVNAYVEKMKPFGLCADFTRRDKDGDDYIPMYPHIRKGKWYPRNPEMEWAYDTSRRRWFRNTNDSILFQYDDATEESINGSIKGAFHPDFRAHALMADEVFLAVRKNWEGQSGKESR
jgi:hypothetical protein